MVLFRSPLLLLGFSILAFASANVANASATGPDMAFEGAWGTQETEYVFHATVKNIGASSATDVTLRLHLFAHSHDPLVYSVPTGCTEPQLQEFNCDLGTVSAGQARSFDVRVEQPVCGSWIEASGYVTADQDVDANNNGNQLTGFDPPMCPTEADGIVYGAGFRDNDGRAIFNFTFANQGPATARNVFFYVLLDTREGFDVEWAMETPVPGCSFGPPEELYCQLGDVAVGHQQSVRVVQATGDCVTVSAMASSNVENEGVYENNSADSVLDGCGLGDVRLTIKLERIYGNQTQLVFVPEGLGPKPAHNVTIYGTLTEPADGWQTAWPETCGLEGPNMTCTFPEVSPWETSFHYAWTNTTCEAIDVYMSIQAENDIHPENNVATAGLPDVCDGAADLAVQNAAWTSDGAYGFATIVTNAGDVAAQNTTLRFSFVDDNSNDRSVAWTVEPASVSCAFVDDKWSGSHAFVCPLGEVPVGESRSIRLSSSSPLCAELHSLARATANNELFVDNNIMRASLGPTACGGGSTETVPTTQVPMFPTPWAWVMAAVGSLGAALFLWQSKRRS